MKDLFHFWNEVLATEERSRNGKKRLGNVGMLVMMVGVCGSAAWTKAMRWHKLLWTECLSPPQISQVDAPDPCGIWGWGLGKLWGFTIWGHRQIKMGFSVFMRKMKNWNLLSIGRHGCHRRQMSPSSKSINITWTYFLDWEIIIVVRHRAVWKL